MASSLKSKKHYSIRSISFPCRSHPSTVKVEEELNKLKTWEAEASSRRRTADVIYNGLSGLGELYETTNDLLSSSQTRQVLAHHPEWVDEFLDESVRLLDVCGSIRDVMSQITLHTRELRSALRRRNVDVSSVSKYTSFRKKMKKDAKRVIASLNQVSNKRRSGSGGLQCQLDLDQHLIAVIRALQEVTAASISVFNTVLHYLSTPVLQPQSSRWSIVARLMHKGMVSCEDQTQNENELENLDTIISISGSSKCQNMVNAQKRLEALETGVQGIENGLECVFRALIRSRASLLNILSQ